MNPRPELPLRTALKVRSLLLGISLSIMLPPWAAATYIRGVTATTDMGAGGTYLENAVNGAGLSSLNLNATHASTHPANSWITGGGVLTGSVTFNLGSVFLVDSFAFWNQNAGGPGAAGSTGINGVQVFYSPDGANFLPLSGGPSAFALAPGLNSPAQTFTFAPVSASAFRFTISSNHGDPNQTGFAEVAFNAVPEPGVLGLTFVGMCVFVARRCGGKR